MWSLAEASPGQDGGGFHDWRRQKEWRSGWPAALLERFSSSEPSLLTPHSSPAPPDTFPSLLFWWPAHSLLRAFVPLPPLFGSTGFFSPSELLLRESCPAWTGTPCPPPVLSPCILLLCPCYSVLDKEGIFVSFCLPQESKICGDKACLLLDLC